MGQRKFRCSVQLDSRAGIMTVVSDAAEVERLGESVVIADAKRQWARSVGASTARERDALQVVVLEEIIGRDRLN